MIESSYNIAAGQMNENVNKFIENKFIESLIPDEIKLTLKLTIEFFTNSKGVIFNDGQLKKLTVFNIIAWLKFLKLAYRYVDELYKIWK